MSATEEMITAAREALQRKQIWLRDSEVRVAVEAALAVAPEARCDCGHRKQSHRNASGECLSFIGRRECTCRLFKFDASGP